MTTLKSRDYKIIVVDNCTYVVPKIAMKVVKHCMKHKWSRGLIGYYAHVIIDGGGKAVKNRRGVPPSV